MATNTKPMNHSFLTPSYLLPLIIFYFMSAFSNFQINGGAGGYVWWPATTDHGGCYWVR
ncbi:hypothetical protein HanXRQr2_Chr07g0316831 [Helianthus annuus]|uniref:Uncharacterized protein n=1 Tax=Helianthus annuus TaxID=4232 RepID=A0A9K3IQ93_HELAN|nr:hypothetical protein HanXRQr2_Chr07g0316831 [Helianthus annuus]